MFSKIKLLRKPLLTNKILRGEIMKKKFTVLFFMLMLVGAFAFSQERPESNWEFSKVIIGSIMPHGVVVTPDDNIWVNVHLLGASHGLVNGGMIIYNPDGTVKTKINEVVIDGVVHGLDDDFNADFGAGRGLSFGHDGKLYSSHYDAVVIWNYENMEPISYILPNGSQKDYPTGSPPSITAAAADEEGNIIVSSVWCNREGVKFFMAGGIFIGMAIDAGNPLLPVHCRDLAITPDGKNLFVANTQGDPDVFGQPSLQHWYSELGTWGEYTHKQTIGDYGSNCEDIYLDKQGRLWIGVNGDTAIGDFEGRYSRYDCWDLEKMEIVDVLVSPFLWGNQNKPIEEFEQGAFGRPRGFCLSNDGTIAYVADYNIGMHEYKLKTPSSTNAPKAIPETFTLSQNYPNPFNPSTKFSYSLPNASDVKIVIYDVFGREVKTLVNDINKPAGEYNVTWNGKDNNNRQAVSGVYFYNMQAAGFNKTMKMVLMK
jgi:sugar lactone lactonase YvrE